MATTTDDIYYVGALHRGLDATNSTADVIFASAIGDNVRHRIVEFLFPLTPMIPTLTADWNRSSTAVTSSAPDLTAVDGGGENPMGAVYFWLTAVTSVLSIGGCLTLIVTDLALRDLRTPGRRLLTWLSVADCLTAVGNFIGVLWYIVGHNGASSVCQFHAALTIFSSIASFLWTVAIATHLYLHVARNNARLANRLIWAFHAVCWTIPGVMSVTAWSLGVLGHDDTIRTPCWCWISPRVDHVNVMFWQYITGKAWEIASYFVIVGLYIPVKSVLQKQVKKRLAMDGFHTNPADHESDQTPANGVQRRRTDLNSDVIADANKRLILVPVVFLTLRIWGTLRFVIGAHWSELNSAMNWIVPLQGVGDSGQGLANCIMFCCLARRVRRRYAALACCRSMRGCCSWAAAALRDRRHVTASRRCDVNAIVLGDFAAREDVKDVVVVVDSVTVTSSSSRGPPSDGHCSAETMGLRRTTAASCCCCCCGQSNRFDASTDDALTSSD